MSDATELLREAEEAAKDAIEAATEALERVKAAREESDLRDDDFAKALDALERFRVARAPDLESALAALHDEAHGNRYPFRLCTRETCRAARRVVGDAVVESWAS